MNFKRTVIIKSFQRRKRRNQRIKRKIRKEKGKTNAEGDGKINAKRFKRI